jgi:DNA-binding MarR family transcriptional regulator
MWNYFLLKGASSLKQKQVITLISRIRRRTNELVIIKLKENGLKNFSPSHGDIIFSLLENEKLTMKEISNKIDRKKNTVTVLIEKLINLGYVEKRICLNDKRACFISLTEKGIQLKNIFVDISDELLKKTYSGLSITDKENGIKFLKTIYENIS